MLTPVVLIYINIYFQGKNVVQFLSSNQLLILDTSLKLCISSTPHPYIGGKV